MKKVLIVDDDEDILTVVELILSNHGFKPLTLSRWEQVDAFVEDFEPDLILMDVDLKGADGRVICKELKQSPETKNIPILLFSAMANLAQHTNGCKADGLVTKPFEIPFLLDSITKNIHNNPTGYFSRSLNS